MTTYEHNGTRYTLAELTRLPECRVVSMKQCAACGIPLERKRYNGRLEDNAIFAARRFCSRQCSASVRQWRPAHDKATTEAEMRERYAALRRQQITDALAAGPAARRGKRTGKPRVSPLTARVLALMAAGHELHLSGTGFWVDTLSSEQRITVDALRRRGWLEPVSPTRYRLSDKGRRECGYGGPGAFAEASEVSGDGREDMEA